MAVIEVEHLVKQFVAGNAKRKKTTRKTQKIVKK